MNGPFASHARLFALLCCLAAVSFAAPHRTDVRTTSSVTLSRPLVLLTWNVQSGRNARGEEDPGAQARFIAKSGADIVALQEVEKAQYANDPSAYASRLKRLTGASWQTVWIPAPMPSNRPPMGNVLLTRFPIDGSTTTQLDSDPSDRSWIDTKRSAGAVTLTVNGVPLHVVTTHLATDDRQRQRQIALLVPWLASIPAPRLVGGDFNMVPDDDTYRMLSASFKDAWLVLGGPDAGVTKEHATPRRIDYWWFDDDGRVKPTAAQVLRTDLSDHHALKLEVKVGNRSERRGQGARRR